MTPSSTVVTLDTTADFGPAPMPTAGRRNLLLAPPSVAAREDRLRDVFATFDRPSTDLQMLDRLSAGLVSLPPAQYDLVLVLTDADGARRPEALQLLARNVYDLVVPSMKPGARLSFQDGPLGSADAREAILAGLVERDGAYEKPADDDAIVPLRLKKKTKKATEASSVPEMDPATLDAASDDEQILNEDDLMTEADLINRPVIPEKCDPKKRRRPCKDCSCGLAAQFEAEDRERRANADQGLEALKLDADDLNELDFTVEGKTGSCNNCYLGDAFRCSSCPYIGLPAFKPGEEVRILNDVAQL